MKSAIKVTLWNLFKIEDLLVNNGFLGIMPLVTLTQY